MSLIQDEDDDLEFLFGSDFCHSRSNLFLVVKNPLDCILPNKVATYQLNGGEDSFEVEGEVEKAICRICLNESLICLKNPSQRFVYSEVFGCFTRLSFYAAVLTEIKKLALIFDKKTWKREAVWMQFFTLIGADKQSDEMLSPIVADTFGESQEINLKDLEIFIISFLLVINLIPNVLSTSKKPLFLPSHKKLKVLMKQNAKEFFNTYTRYLPLFLGNLEPMLMLDVDEIALVVEAKMLDYWKEELDKIEIESKEKLARLSRIPDMRSFTDGNPVEDIIKEWINNINENKSDIRKLFQAVVALNERRVLQENCFSRDHVSQKFEQFLHEIAREDVIKTSMITALLVDNSSSIARRAASVPVRYGENSIYNDDIKNLVESRHALSSEDIVLNRMQPLVNKRKNKSKKLKMDEKSISVTIPKIREDPIQ